jgi:hypothetical protein
MLHISPMPEALDGHRWTVEEGCGSCNTVTRSLLVPMGENSSDRFIRNHEMAHAKITPRHSASKLVEKYGLSMDAMQVCEDLRVHRFLSTRGIDCSGALLEPEIELCIDRSKTSVRKLALLLVASLYTDDYPRAIAALRTRINEHALNTILEKIRLVDGRMNTARNLFRPIGFRNATVPAAKLFDALFPTGETINERPRDALDAVPHEALLTCERKVSPTRAVTWGKLTIANLPSAFLRRLPRVTTHKNYRDEGAALAAPWRLPVDGRIFCRRKPRPGGTVLIDQSGSMNLSQKRLAHIVTIAPMSTVAIYCGRSTTGTLTIIGKKGRFANPDGIAQARVGPGNIVDGPALEWLGKQAEPRIWVSDGFVTGKHDCSSVDLAAEALALCHKYRIRRIPKPKAVCDFFRKPRK